MRQIGTLPDAIQARMLADYLLTMRIETKLEQGPDSWIVWACDEDRVPQARQEFEAFLKEPRAERYAASSHAADAIRKERDATEEDYERRQTELRKLMAEPLRRNSVRPVTYSVIAVAVAIYFVLLPGNDLSEHVMQTLAITDYRIEGQLMYWDGLSAISRGQVWRLFTPALLHFSFMGIPLAHLLFNVIMLYQLGGMFEDRRGSIRFLLFILLVAAGSNLAEYYLGWTTQISDWSKRTPTPLFGGLSGVNYGIFGYIWMKVRYSSDSGFVLGRDYVVTMVVWLILCITGLLGPVANVAHIVGLAIGALIGSAPVLWQNLRRRLKS